MHREAGRNRPPPETPRVHGSREAEPPGCTGTGRFPCTGRNAAVHSGGFVFRGQWNPLDAWESRGNPASGDRTAGPLRAKPRMRGNRVKTMHPKAGYKPPSRETPCMHGPPETEHPGCGRITRKPASERRARSDPGSARELVRKAPTWNLRNLPQTHNAQAFRHLLASKPQSDPVITPRSQNFFISNPTRNPYAYTHFKGPKWNRRDIHVRSMRTPCGKPGNCL